MDTVAKARGKELFLGSRGQGTLWCYFEMDKVYLEAIGKVEFGLCCEFAGVYGYLPSKEKRKHIIFFGQTYLSSNVIT